MGDHPGLSARAPNIVTEVLLRGRQEGIGQRPGDAATGQGVPAAASSWKKRGGDSPLGSLLMALLTP